MKRILMIVSLCLVLGVSMANASVTPCLGSSISNVMGQTFSCFGLTFSNFVVSTTNPTTGETVGVDSTATGRDSLTSNIDIAFQFSGVTNPSNTDIQITYYVQGPTIGVDWAFANTNSGGAITLGETVCPANSGGFTGATCTLGSPLALTPPGGGTGVTITSSNTQQVGSALFVAGSQPAVYIHKDISFSNGFMSEFINSNDIPEPMTITLLGAGLLALGLLRRKKAA
jgi:hypothetical protein